MGKALDRSLHTIVADRVDHLDTNAQQHKPEGLPISGRALRLRIHLHEGVTDDTLASRRCGDVSGEFGMQQVKHK
jgi:hypothetical protein